MPGRSTGETRPDLLTPLFVVLFGDGAENWRRDLGRSVSARLALHQDKLDVVLNDRVRFVWLPEEAAFAILCQMIGARLSKPMCRQCS